MSITFGPSGRPSQITVNFNALFATSLANYKKTLQDNISSSNAFFHALKENGMWESRDGGAWLAEDLMYELGQFDSYDGHDELGDLPTDGLTQVQFEWRQGAVPISYSEKERKMNKHRLVDLVQTKIKQAEMGFTEGFNKAILQGSLSQSSSGSLLTPFTSPVNGSQFIDPLPRIIAFDPTTSASIGNIAQDTNTWWRNRTKTSALTSASTFSAFLQEADNMYNNCSKGPGGAPKLILVDQSTFELWNAAYYDKYRRMADVDGNYPFPNIKFRQARVVWDEYVPDVYTGVTSTATYGSAFFINAQFLKVVYESETNFEMTKFQKPPKGDSRLAHILWMGQITCSNRRKLGVWGKIPRALVTG